MIPHRLIRLWFSIAAVGVLSVSCIAERNADGVEGGEYVTVRAEVGDVRDAVPATGMLISNTSAEVRAGAAGTIAEVFVNEGDRVSRGQLLARLEAPAALPVRDEVQAGSAAAMAGVREAEVALRTAELDRQRRRSLVERGFVSPASLEALNSQVAQAEAALDRAQAEARAAAARVRRETADARTSEIRAPLAGVVTYSRARVGLRVGPEDEHALFQTTDSTDHLSLEIMIPEPDVSRVNMDSRVSFTVDAYPSIRHEAQLQSIGNAPLRDGRFVSYRALATVTNPVGQLLPGMSASVELTRADSRQVMRIPARALIFRPRDYLPPMPPEELERQKKASGGDMSLVRAGADGAEFGRLLREGKRLVFSLQDGRLVRHEIRIGAETEDFVEVTEGLRGGEMIVVSHRVRADPT
jgi:HlyD family secretion protein